MINLEKGGKNARTLLQFLPQIAGKTQSRFASNFQMLLLHADNIVVEDVLYIVHYEQDEKRAWEITGSLRELVSLCKEHGNNCQVLQINADGYVISL